MDTAVSEGNPLNEMSEYEQQVWSSLNSHWQRRNNRRGLPNWAGTAIERTGDAATTTFDRLAGAIPEGVREPMRRGADVALDTALRPALAASVPGSCDVMARTATAELQPPLARSQRLDSTRCTGWPAREIQGVVMPGVVVVA